MLSKFSWRLLVSTILPTPALRKGNSVHPYPVITSCGHTGRCFSHRHTFTLGQHGREVSDKYYKFEHLQQLVRPHLLITNIMRWFQYFLFMGLWAFFLNLHSASFLQWKYCSFSTPLNIFDRFSCWLQMMFITHKTHDYFIEDDALMQTKLPQYKIKMMLCINNDGYNHPVI